MRSNSLRMRLNSRLSHQDKGPVSSRTDPLGHATIYRVNGQAFSFGFAVILISSHSRALLISYPSPLDLCGLMYSKAAIISMEMRSFAESRKGRR
jgi:hypothetical protein